MANKLMYISEEEVQSLLDWDSLASGISHVMAEVSQKTKVIQPARIFMRIPQKNAAFLAMPAFSEGNRVLSCKLITSFLENPTYNLPRLMSTIMVFDPDTGQLRAVVEGNTITEMRTAAASVVATRALRPNSGPNQILAVLGAGRQGRVHIIAFQHFFKFEKVNLWNRTYETAKKLAEELQRDYQIKVDVFQHVHDCTRKADVIVTGTNALTPILNFKDVKPNVMINAVGANLNHYSELGSDIYEKAAIYTDSFASADGELKGLKEQGFEILGEIGELTSGEKRREHNGVIVFQSLGMAAEDAVAAKLVLDGYIKKMRQQQQ